MPSEWRAPSASSSTAEFAITVYNLTYTAGANGRVTGASPQTLSYGASAAPVTAVADVGYAFDSWSDGSTSNPRTDASVAADLAVTALFAASAQVVPDGSSLAVLGAGEVAAGRGVWDLSGTYSTEVGGMPLVIHLVHDSKGKLTGTAALTVLTVVTTLPIKGAVRGAEGSLSARFGMKGVSSNRALRAAFAFDLTLNATTRQLVGQVTGSLSAAGITAPVEEPATLDLPASMDGTWALRFALVPGAKTVGGSATLTLSNGVAYECVVHARLSGLRVVGDLTAAPADVSARGIRIRATMSQWSGGWARLEALAGTAYGQALAW